MTWQLIASKKLNQDYRGPAESCSYIFTVNLPDQLGARWTAEQNLQAHIEKLQEQGSQVLEWHLWEDKMSGTFTTDYYCEVVASASPLLWTVVVVGVLAILGILATTWLIAQVKEIAKYAPQAIPWLTIGAIAFVTLAGVLVIRRR